MLLSPNSHYVFTTHAQSPLLNQPWMQTLEATDQSGTTVRFLFADHIPVVTYVVLLSTVPLM